MRSDTLGLHASRYLKTAGLKVILAEIPHVADATVSRSRSSQLSYLSAVLSWLTPLYASRVQMHGYSICLKDGCKPLGKVRCFGWMQLVVYAARRRWAQCPAARAVTCTAKCAACGELPSMTPTAWRWAAAGMRCSLAATTRERHTTEELSPSLHHAKHCASSTVTAER